jgi:DNA-binding NarL/FixJ family response regulator
MKPTRILIADDQPVIQHGLAAIFAAHAADWEICTTASDGPQALREALCYRPEIVIMEYALPRLNGLTAARHIKQGLPSAEILIFTGASSPRILLEIFRSKVCGSLLKNEAIEELFPALIALRQHHPFRSRGMTDLCEKILARAEPFLSLTARELEVLLLTTHGRSCVAIATDLGLSVDTVETHRKKAYKKLNVTTAAEATRRLFECGMENCCAGYKVTNERSNN